MSKDRDEKFDPSQPALIVKYGNTKRKHRPLDREVLVLGRAPGCDLGLDAPDVSPVHCVIVRAADGWRVRDCTGKGGTRVNGQSVQDAVLADEDVLQVGSFSFTLHLPPDHQPLGGTGEPSDHALGRVRRSRYNLARLALRLRGRVAEMESAVAERADDQLAARQDELDRQAEQLRVLQQDVDARFGDLKQAAQDVAARSAALEERRRRVEEEAVQRPALEEAHSRSLADKERALRQWMDDASRDLEIRARELTGYSGHLRRLRLRLNEHEESLAARWEEWLREQQEASIAQTRQSERIAREETTLREQRAEVVRLMGEMRQLRQQPDPRAETLREENEQLRRNLAERETDAAAAREQARLRFEEAEALRGRLGAAEDANDEGALRRFVVELDMGRRVLDEQIREVQGRFIDMERAAREAEMLIARERERMSAEREELERLRGGLWPGDGRSPGAETLVDMPSPLSHLPEMAPAGDAIMTAGPPE